MTRKSYFTRKGARDMTPEKHLEKLTYQKRVELVITVVLLMVSILVLTSFT
jgi:hypothetical protein